MKMIELDKTPLKKEDIYDIGGYKLVYGKNYKELRYDVNNGVTLCKECHNKTKGWKND